MEFSEIEIEKTYRDRLTGYVGICTARVEYRDHAAALLENESTQRWVESDRLQKSHAGA